MALAVIPCLWYSAAVVHAGRACRRSKYRRFPKFQVGLDLYRLGHTCKTFDLSTLVAEADISLRVYNQPGPHSKF